MKDVLTTKTYIERGRLVKERLIRDGLYRNWRISPEPFHISGEEISLIESLGTSLYSFYRASNKLYFDSLKGRQPAWVSGYLDQGKPQALLDYGRMNRMRGLLPGVIRPDIILTEDGMIATELDSVPGGIGITGSLAMAYSDLHGDRVFGNRSGMIDGFISMLRAAGSQEEQLTAIVVSEESKEYWSEMEWLAGAIQEKDGRAHAVRPEDILFTEEGLFIASEEKRERVDVLYRFFELFDLKNIPKAELIMYSNKKRCVTVTPPFKPFLEEKMLYALFHHPLLKRFWVDELGDEVFSILSGIFPATWILDPSDMPPYGVIPGLEIGTRPVACWRNIAEATQSEREFVIKPSGFSEMAWGSRGVVAGHDVSQEAWRDAIDKALQDFNTTPYILQKFHKGRHVEVDYLDEYEGGAGGSIRKMKGRVRLCPYYFVEEEGVRLRGIMATICPLEKKLIHGMEDAVITVVGIQ